MYKLLNMADFCSNEELEKEMQYLSQKYGFDGFELIKFFDGDNSPLKKYIKGYHMRFFPSWMELYLEDFTSLYDELKDGEDLELAHSYVGIGDKDNAQKYLDLARDSIDKQGTLNDDIKREIEEIEKGILSLKN